MFYVHRFEEPPKNVSMEVMDYCDGCRLRMFLTYYGSYDAEYNYNLVNHTHQYCAFCLPANNDMESNHRHGLELRFPREGGGWITVYGLDAMLDWAVYHAPYPECRLQRLLPMLNRLRPYLKPNV